MPRDYDAGMPKECPMCGEFMRLVTRESVSRLPGTTQEVKTPVREWVCPECDYFEEAEASDT
jgi:hypothetical protein